MEHNCLHNINTIGLEGFIRRIVINYLKYGKATHDWYPTIDLVLANPFENLYIASNSCFIKYC